MNEMPGGRLRTRRSALGVTPWLVLLLGACHKPPFDYAAGIGVAVALPERSCLDIRNGALSAGQRLHFVTASSPQTEGELEISGRVDQACTAADQNSPGLYHYGFKVVRGSLERADPAIALANIRGTLSASGPRITGDVDGDGQPESFRYCTSPEGLHLTVWSGKPLESRRRWHYYYYLGYDAEPDCKEGDTKSE